MKTAATSVAILSALALTTYAKSATVTIGAIPSEGAHVQPVEVTGSVCQLITGIPECVTLELLSVSGAPNDSVVCQDYKDAAGTVNGGLPFTFGNPSLLATNPVEVGSIRCSFISGGNSTCATSGSSSPGGNSTVGGTNSTKTGGASATLGASKTPVQPSGSDTSATASPTSFTGGAESAAFARGYGVTAAIVIFGAFGLVML